MWAYILRRTLLMIPTIFGVLLLTFALFNLVAKDPARVVAVACLTDRDYGPWALQAWPPLSDAIIEALER